MVARANDSVSSHGPLTTSALLAPFEATSASQRANRFRRALGLRPVMPTPRPIPLGSPDLLVSRRRAQLIAERG
jgi:hypothetical protein